MMMNIWKSVYTNKTYEMPIDWLPQFEGWELVGTIEKQCLTKFQARVYNKEKREVIKMTVAHNWSTDETRTFEGVKEIKRTLFDWYIIFLDDTIERFSTFYWDIFETR